MQIFNFGKVYKYLDAMTGKFYSIKKALTYGRPAIFVTGSRNLGKSTTVALLSLLTYIVYGKKFMYVRRRKTDVDNTYKSFFDNALEIYNRKAKELGLREILGFKAHCKHYYIAFEKDEEDKLIWEECGFYTPVTEEEHLKSSVFSDYVIIIYDEFIAKESTTYLGTLYNTDVEWDKLTSLYQTVDRGVDKAARNETVLICLGNKATVYNPLFKSLGIVDYVQPPGCPQPKFTAPKGQAWVWQDIDKVEATVNIDQSNAFALSSNRVKEYAYNNIGIERTEFVKRAERPTVYDRTVRIKGKEYGISHDSNYMYYIDNPKPGYAVLSLDHQSHDGTDKEMIINGWNRDPVLLNVGYAYHMGKLYFKDGKTQDLFLGYLDFVDK